MCPWDWSPDGQGLVVSSDQFTQYQSLYLLPLRAAPHAEAEVKPLASDPKYDLWQLNVSPNGRWIAFVAQHIKGGGTGTVAVMPIAGAASSQWTHVTDTHDWADKPRWSPDGNLLYFIRRQASLLLSGRCDSTQKRARLSALRSRLPTSIARVSSSRLTSRTVKYLFRRRGSFCRSWKPAATSGCSTTWIAKPVAGNVLRVRVILRDSDRSTAAPQFY